MLVIYLIWPAVDRYTEFFSEYAPEAVYPVTFCLAGALLFIAAVVMTFKVGKRPGEGFAKADSVMSVVLLFICIIGSWFYMSLPGMLFNFIAIAASFVMLWRTESSGEFKTVVMILSGMLTLCLIFLSLMKLNASALTEVSESASPDGSKIARTEAQYVYHHGNIVEVKLFNVCGYRLLGTVRLVRINSDHAVLWESARAELTDETGRVSYPEVEWKEDSTVIINGEEYSVD